MDWRKVHDSIIFKGKSSGRYRGDGNYYEGHHILPKCLGGKKNKENMVLLTAREHYIVHKLLYELNPNNKSFLYAVHRMTHSKNYKHKRDYRISAREYERLRIACSEDTRGEKNPMFGKTHSLEAIEKIRSVHLGTKKSEEFCNNRRQYMSGDKNPMLGKTHSEEAVAKMRAANIGKKLSEEHKISIGAKQKGKNNHFYKKKHSEESLSMMSESLKRHYKENGHPFSGRNHKEEAKIKMSESWKLRDNIKCPHCGLESINAGNMNRWHFDNCKQKQGN